MDPKWKKWKFSQFARFSCFSFSEKISSWWILLSLDSAFSYKKVPYHDVFERHKKTPFDYCILKRKEEGVFF